jgi:hypothetical protein
MASFVRSTCYTSINEPAAADACSNQVSAWSLMVGWHTDLLFCAAACHQQAAPGSTRLAQVSPAHVVLERYCLAPFVEHVCYIAATVALWEILTVCSPPAVQAALLLST